MTTATQVLQRLGPRAALSHETAARDHGVELVEDDGTERVTVPADARAPTVAGWVVVRRDLDTSDVEEREGRRVTTVVRTLADLARVLPLDRAVAAADSALRQGLVELATVVAVLGAAKGRHAAKLRRVAALVDPASGSVLESLLRVLLVEAGLPRPRSQYEVRWPEGRLIARVDFAWVAERLLLEVDGYAFHSDRDAYRRDRNKMNSLEEQGWRVLRVTWEDVLSSPHYVVALVRACLAQAA